MDKNLLWEGRPSFWVATGTFYKLFKTIIVCAIVLYLTKYLPAWNIPVPKIIPVPESIAQFGGIVFYILVYFVCLFVIRLKGFI
ncbi:MAG: hypothetical protein KKH99_14300, partial [Proteobacteria bacterium]|nr:hypothetical protein [Pseudomonadota bacterium]